MWDVNLCVFFKKTLVTFFLMTNYLIQLCHDAHSASTWKGSWFDHHHHHHQDWFIFPKKRNYQVALVSSFYTSITIVVYGAIHWRACGESAIKKDEERKEKTFFFNLFMGQYFVIAQVMIMIVYILFLLLDTREREKERKKM